MRIRHKLRLMHDKEHYRVFWVLGKYLANIAWIFNELVMILYVYREGVGGGSERGFY